MLPMYYKNDDIRRKQINTLKIFNDHVTEITQNSEYEIPFQSGGNDLLLKITLGQDFPNEKPVLKVVPPVIHHWVQADGTVIAAPGLLNFTVHSDLGRVVQAVIREFQRNPPEVITSTSKTSASIPILNSIDNDNKNISNFGSSYENLNSSFSPPQSHAMPTAASKTTYHSVAFPELNTMSIEDLQFLIQNDDKQQEFIDNLPHIREQSRVLEETLEQVLETAETNLGKKEEFKHLKDYIDVQIEEVTKLAFENERLSAVYQNLSDKYAPRYIQEQLKVAAIDSDKESDSVAAEFLEGKLDVDKFITKFLNVKTLSQLRKTKEEKLCNQLDSLERAGF